jgi:hypothetical protein
LFNGFFLADKFASYDHPCLCSKDEGNLSCLNEPKTGGLHLKTHLSHPPNDSINDYIDMLYTKETYSPFDNAVSIVKKFGKSALMAKMDIPFFQSFLVASPTKKKSSR